MESSFLTSASNIAVAVCKQSQRFSSENPSGGGGGTWCHLLTLQTLHSISVIVSVGELTFLCIPYPQQLDESKSEKKIHFDYFNSPNVTC